MNEAAEKSVRTIHVTSCPVLMTDPLVGDPFPCGEAMDAHLWVHAEGAEYGVFTDYVVASPLCGHPQACIEISVQNELLGIAP